MHSNFDRCVFVCPTPTVLSSAFVQTDVSAAFNTRRCAGNWVSNTLVMEGIPCLGNQGHLQTPWLHTGQSLICMLLGRVAQGQDPLQEQTTCWPLVLPFLTEPPATRQDLSFPEAPHPTNKGDNRSFGTCVHFGFFLLGSHQYRSSAGAGWRKGYC
jgi:hypothetical protein